MATQIFVNLPVKDLKRSVEFFTRLGYKFNPQFTDENATCMIVGENIFVMLLVESFFKTVTKKELCDATKSTEVLVCLSCEAEIKSMKWLARQSPPAAPPRMNPRTTGSCTNMASRI